MYVWNGGRKCALVEASGYVYVKKKKAWSKRVYVHVGSKCVRVGELV